jgi:hypothetical protein
MPIAIPGDDDSVPRERLRSYLEAYYTSADELTCGADNILAMVAIAACLDFNLTCTCTPKI